MLITINLTIPGIIIVSLMMEPNWKLLTTVTRMIIPEMMNIKLWCLNSS